MIKEETIDPGALYVVATPIGNLGDISARAAGVLESVDRILCEDTRRCRTLLKHLGLSTRLTSFFDHNEERRTRETITALRRGETFALVSDAGTPAIADPGYRLITAAVAAGIPIVPIPGPSSVTAALSVCGLPIDRFVFEGFLPAKSGKRRTRLEELAGDSRTAVLFESPHRIGRLLTELTEVYGADRPACVCRELTKRFEEIRRGAIGELAAQFEESARRGEFVVIVAGQRQSKGTKART